MQSIYTQVKDQRQLGTLKLSVWEGCIWQIYATWLLGPIFIGFLSHLGASPTQLAFAGSVPFMAQLIGPLTAWWVSQVKKRKRLMFFLGLVSRLMGVVPVSLVFSDAPSQEKVGWLLVALVLTHVFQSAAGVIWQGLMGDVVPGMIRGRYFGMRNGLMGICAMAASLGGGLLLDRVIYPTSYGLLFGTGVTLSLVSAVMYLLYHDPHPSTRSMTLSEVLLNPIRDPKFQGFLKTVTVWGGAQAFSTVMIVPYLLQELKFTMTEVGLYAGIMAAAGLLVNYSIGWAVDRISNRRVLVVGILGSALLIPGLLVALHFTHWTPLVWVLAAAEATIYSAVNLALFNVGMEKTTPSDRIAYLSASNLTSGGAAFAAGLLSGWVVSALGHTSVPSYLGYFLLCVLVRLLCLLPLRNLHLRPPTSDLQE